MPWIVIFQPSRRAIASIASGVWATVENVPMFATPVDRRFQPSALGPVTRWAVPPPPPPQNLADFSAGEVLPMAFPPFWVGGEFAVPGAEAGGVPGVVAVPVA